MPRETLPIPQRVDTLSVLSAEGELDTELEPKLSDTHLRKLYKTMLAARRLDERCIQLQRQGRMGTYPPSRGQEAASLGVVADLKTEDWVVPSFREVAAQLWRGWPMSRLLLLFGGHELGAQTPEHINDLPICVPVASQCQYATGVAWGLKLRGEGHVCTAFVGDGGTSEGDFHEAMNFAGVYQVPLVMIVQNNQWAISIPRKRQTASDTIAQKAIAYGFDGIQVDGNDILAMIVAAREAVERARSGGGPTLIEAVTYRLSVHTTADDPKKYRRPEEVTEWEQRDPLLRFGQYLRQRKLLDDKIEQLIEEEIAREIREAVEEYERFEVNPLEFFEHMYAEKTPDLAAQREQFERYRSGADGSPSPRPDYSGAV